MIAVSETRKTRFGKRHFVAPMVRRAGRRHPARCAGVTLVELLTVIAIVTLLSALVVTGSYMAVTRGRRNATEGLFETIAQGLAQYKNLHHMYVPSDPRDGSYVESKTSLPLSVALETEGRLIAVKDDCKQRADTYTDPNTDQAVPRFYYIDPWGTPIIYICRGPLFKTYTLISYGPDRTRNTDDEIIFPPE